MALRTIIFVIAQMLLCSTLLGELTIKAPEDGKEHEVVEFSVETDKKDVLIEVNKTLFKDVKAYKLESNKAGVLKYVFTAPPGKYRIKAIGFDPGIEIDTAVVEIKGNASKPVPDDPEEPEIGDYSKVETTCAELVKKLNDQPTQDRLRLTIAGVDFDGSLSESKALLKTAIVGVLASRQGNSRLVDWNGGWRVPLNTEIEKANVTTIGQFKKLIQAIVSGLAKTTNQVAQTVAQSNCYFCQQCGTFHCR